MACFLARFWAFYVPAPIQETAPDNMAVKNFMDEIDRC